MLACWLLLQGRRVGNCNQVKQKRPFKQYIDVYAKKGNTPCRVTTQNVTEVRGSVTYTCEGAYAAAMTHDR